MIAVAAVALLLGLVAETARRRSEYLRLAARHQELSLRNGSIFGGGVMICSNPITRKSEMTSPPKIEHHERLAEKYRQAARFPWLPLEPVPPRAGLLERNTRPAGRSVNDPLNVLPRAFIRRLRADGPEDPRHPIRRSSPLR